MLAAIALSVLCLGAKQFVMPAAQPAKTYPARDEHSDEAVTLALDPPTYWRQRAAMEWT